MKAIVAVDMNRGIGKNGKLLFHIRDDLMRFKKLTMGNVVIMGRNTFESLPKHKPLEGRTNIILTRNITYHADGCIVAHNLSDIEKNIIPKFENDNIFVIGGGEIYKLLLPLCDTVYITHINTIRDSDTFFPNLPADEWYLGNEDISDIFYDEESKLSYSFMTYHRK